MAHGFKPEQLVQSVRGKTPLIACMAEADLQQLAMHANAGEKTKASAMFPARCFTLEPGQAYKVLSIRPWAIEIGLLAQTAPDGIWTFPEAFAPLPKK